MAAGYNRLPLKAINCHQLPQFVPNGTADRHSSAQGNWDSNAQGGAVPATWGTTNWGSSVSCGSFTRHSRESRERAASEQREGHASYADAIVMSDFVAARNDARNKPPEKRLFASDAPLLMGNSDGERKVTRV